jgi:hypothetical protein
LGHLAQHLDSLGTRDLAWWQLGNTLRRSIRMPIVGLVAWLAFVLWLGAGLVGALVEGLGFVGGLGIGLGALFSGTVWGQWVVFSRIWLPLTGRLPWAVMDFLEAAHQRGVAPSRCGLSVPPCPTPRPPRSRLPPTEMMEMY